MTEILIHSLEELPSAAAAFLNARAGRNVFAFNGDMGAGKTTFIAEICRALKVVDEPASPTFSLINEYATECGDSIFHFDFYRLKSAAEAADIGAEDYLYSGALCLIEWPQRVEEILPEDTVYVNINVLADGSRSISF